MIKLSMKTVSSLEKCFWDEALESKREKRAFVMFQNERLSFQVVYRAEDDSRDISRWCPVTVSGPLAEYASVRMVGNILNMYPTYNVPFEGELLRREPGAYPDLLRPLPYEGCISLPNGQTLALWVDIELPEGFAAGEYDFSLSVHKSGELLGEVSCRITVLSATLPKQTLIHTEWFHADSLANYYHTKAFSERHFRYIEAFLKTAVKNGINMILTPIFTPALDTRVGGERLTTQLVDISLDENGRYHFHFDKLDRFVTLVLSLGVEYFEIPHLFTQWGAKAAPKIVVKVGSRRKKLFGWHTPATSPEYADFLSQFLPALVAYFKSHGIDKRCYYHISDEPSLKAMEHYIACKNLVEPYLEGAPIIDAQSSLEFFESGALKKPIPNTRSAMKYIDAGVRNLWVYHCGGGNAGVADRSVSMPLRRTRILGVQLYLYRIEGFLHWGYNFYNTCHSRMALDPYQSPDCAYFTPTGDSFLVYPGTDGEAWESLRLNALREGLDDMRALMLCESKFGREATEALILSLAGGKLTFTEYPTSDEFLITLREAIAKAFT